jgi:signal transduction histidine kinase
MRPGRNPSVWRDLGLAVALAATSGVIAARFDLHESMFSWTRRWEWLQLDEFPVALLVFALCLAVMNARRLMDLRGLLRENRLLAQRALAVQEAERKHLARELHDELGQYLNAIKLDSQAIPAERPAEPVLAAAQRIAANADHVYATVGNMIRRLRPAALDELGLASALEACIDRWRALKPSLTVRLAIEGDLQGLGETMDLALYRIVQEALTNCVRHAEASWASVQLRRAAGAGIDLTVEDNGRGMGRARQDSPGHGLAGIRERVDLLGGSFAMLSGPEGGVTIRIHLPPGMPPA